MSKPSYIWHVLHSDDHFSQNIRSITLPKTNSQSPWKPWWQRETIKLLLGVYLFSRAFAVSFRECVSQNLSPKETPLTDHMVGYVGANSLGSCNLLHLTGQIIATSHDLGPQKVAEKEKSMEIRLFHGNLGWWNISIWPEFESCKSLSQPGVKKTWPLNNFFGKYRSGSNNIWKKIRAQTASDLSLLNETF